MWKNLLRTTPGSPPAAGGALTANREHSWELQGEGGSQVTLWGSPGPATGVCLSFWPGLQA